MALMGLSPLWHERLDLQNASPELLGWDKSLGDGLSPNHLSSCRLCTTPSVCVLNPLSLQISKKLLFLFSNYLQEPSIEEPPNNTEQKTTRNHPYNTSHGWQGGQGTQQHLQAQLHILPAPLSTVYLHQDDLFQQTNLFGEESNGREGAAALKAQRAKELLFGLGAGTRPAQGAQGGARYHLFNI